MNESTASAPENDVHNQLDLSYADVDPIDETLGALRDRLPSLNASHPELRAEVEGFLTDLGEP